MISSQDNSIQTYLARHPSFGSWKEEWDGIPLEFRTCLSQEIPPLNYVGSVRAIVLRGEDVLLIHSSVPILSVGGRRKQNETLEQTLLREVAEETGWKVSPLGIIGFIHCRHLDNQRPNWGRPAPDFIDPLFAVVAEEFDEQLLEPSALRSEFVPRNKIEEFGIDEINRKFLLEAQRNFLNKT